MTDEEQIITRLMNVLSTRKFELSTFLSLFDIRFSDDVETACVTCGLAPVMKLNKAFVAEHCQTDEHLFMLVMHELYHVILGHTRLFPRSTPARNIAFDAVINALLCSLFPESEFTSFFTDYYPSDTLPYALLRPRGPNTPAAAAFALRLLYDENGTGTYYDIFELIAQAAAEGDDWTNGLVKGPVLLGSHSAAEGGQGEERQALDDYIHAIIAKWPSPDRPLCGRDLGAGLALRDYRSRGDERTRRLRKGVRRLMRLAAQPGRREIERTCQLLLPSFAETFLPDGHDRLHAAKERLLGESLVYGTQLNTCRLSRYDRRFTFVYLDVSGSVSGKVAAIADELLPYLRHKMCRLHVFSTMVAPTCVQDLKNHRFTSSGGTDITCVAEHVLSLPSKCRPKSIVVITDGDTGPINDSLLARLRSSGVRMYVGLVAGEDGRTNETDLGNFARAFVHLSEKEILTNEKTHC